MRIVSHSTFVMFLAMILSTVICVGCSGSKKSGAAAEQDAAQPTFAGDDHSGWWCPTHGVPEEICAQCNSALAAKYQQKGDWCEEHSRPDSQCFICHPELAAKFAAQYQAKYGTQPPGSPTQPSTH